MRLVPSQPHAFAPTILAVIDRLKQKRFGFLGLFGKNSQSWFEQTDNATNNAYVLSAASILSAVPSLKPTDQSGATAPLSLSEIAKASKAKLAAYYAGHLFQRLWWRLTQPLRVYKRLHALLTLTALVTILSQEQPILPSSTFFTVYHRSYLPRWQGWWSRSIKDWHYRIDRGVSNLFNISKNAERIEPSEPKPSRPSSSKAVIMQPLSPLKSQLARLGVEVATLSKTLSDESAFDWPKSKALLETLFCLELSWLKQISEQLGNGQENELLVNFNETVKLRERLRKQLIRRTHPDKSNYRSENAVTIASSQTADLLTLLQNHKQVIAQQQDRIKVKQSIASVQAKIDEGIEVIKAQHRQLATAYQALDRSNTQTAAQLEETKVKLQTNETKLQAIETRLARSITQQSIMQTKLQEIEVKLQETINELGSLSEKHNALAKQVQFLLSMQQSQQPSPITTSGQTLFSAQANSAGVELEAEADPTQPTPSSSSHSG